MRKMTYNEIVRFHNRFPNLEIEGYVLEDFGPSVGSHHEKIKRGSFHVETGWEGFANNVQEIEYDISAHAIEVPEFLDTEVEFGTVNLRTTQEINNIKIKTVCPPEFAINYLLYGGGVPKKADCAEDIIISTKKYNLHLYNAMILGVEQCDEFGIYDVEITIDWFKFSE